ncbi:MAG: 4Fe-4S dicluster domain-containing protein [Muribaculaceae bacterium]|nr:4Fe-4S dicluster domain-containing protein [Muribaculaceae bacterium]
MSSHGYRWLRAARIAVSLAVLATVTATVACGYSCWLSQWQIIPALLAGSGAWLLLWAAATALTGRIYCSTACPMGTLQDLAARMKRRRNGYFFSAPKTMLRLSVVFAMLVAAMLGISVVIGVLDPAAAYARIGVYLGRPIAGAAAFSVGAAAIAFATLAATTVAAMARGRLLCNTICPVGTILGTLSRYALYHIDINTDKCTGCGLCTSRCKAECIDPTAHTVDASRCVMCFDCTAVCPDSAITLRRGRHRLQIPMLQAVEPEATAYGKPDTTGTDIKTLDRRQFLTAIAAIPLAATAGSPDISTPLNAVCPPGATGNFNTCCTGCGLCTAACPTGIIRPSTSQFGIRNALHPVLDFNIGECRYDCVACTKACPTGALTPLTPRQKHRSPIGKARIEATLCIEYTHGHSCGKCARVCPAQSVRLIPIETDNGIRRLPHIDFDSCIGCGACRYHCPTTPHAIIIEGI